MAAHAVTTHNRRFGPGPAGDDLVLPRGDGRPAHGGAGVRGRQARASSRSGAALRDPYAWHALKLTFVTALVMVVDQRRDRHGDRLGPGAL